MRTSAGCVGTTLDPVTFSFTVHFRFSRLLHRTTRYLNLLRNFCSRHKQIGQLPRPASIETLVAKRRRK